MKHFIYALVLIGFGAFAVNSLTSCNYQKAISGNCQVSASYTTTDSIQACITCDSAGTTVFNFFKKLSTPKGK